MHKTNKILHNNSGNWCSRYSSRGESYYVGKGNDSFHSLSFKFIEFVFFFCILARQMDWFLFQSLSDWTHLVVNRSVHRYLFVYTELKKTIRTDSIPIILQQLFWYWPKFMAKKLKSINIIIDIIMILVISFVFMVS